MIKSKCEAFSVDHSVDKSGRDSVDFKGLYCPKTLLSKTAIFSFIRLDAHINSCVDFLIHNNGVEMITDL